jgi:outer membrane protein assembly factor BamB
MELEMSRLRRIVVLCTTLALSGRVFGGTVEWPEFRGPTGQGISLATNVPIRWSAAESVKWKAAIAPGWSSPVVSAGHIYLTAAVQNGNNISLHALCFDESDARSAWDVEVLQPVAADTKKIHSKNSLASPTPIVRDGRIFVHFGHMGTAALDLSGKVLWRQTGIKYSPVHGNGGSPALVDDLLIFSCDGASDPFLAALDANTGAVRWKTPRNSPARSQFSFCTPLLIEVGGQRELISPASGFVGAYNPKDGRELWRVRYGEGYSVVPRPVYAHGLLFLSSGFDRPIVYAINPKGAQGDATLNHVAWTNSKGAPTTPSPLVVGNEVYLVSDGGIASCLDSLTGKVHWSERLGGGFSASPVAAEGRIYFQSESGMGYVVKAAKTYELLAKNDLGERSLASPAILDNCILIRTESHLWRIGK